MKIAISTDHTGFEKLQVLAQYITSLGHECINYGPQLLDVGDDYPDYIVPAARAVAGGACNMGIIMGGSGQGEAIVANRLKGVRCAVFYGPVMPESESAAEGTQLPDAFEIIRLSRTHNNANMLSLAARFVSTEDMQRAVEIWLSTSYGQEERHQRRIQKIDNLA